MRRSGAPPGAFRPMALSCDPDNSRIELCATAYASSHSCADRSLSAPAAPWRQPDPLITCTSNGEYSTLQETSIQQADPRTRQMHWDPVHHLLFSRVNSLLPSNMRAYFDRDIPLRGNRDRTLAFPCVHDLGCSQDPSLSPAEAAMEDRFRKTLERHSVAEKRKALTIPYLLTPEVADVGEFRRRAGGRDKRVIRTVPERSMTDPLFKMDSTAVSDCKHAVPWDDTAHIMHSRMNGISPVNFRSYFDRTIEGRGKGDMTLIPRSFPATWLLRNEVLTEEEKHQRRLEELKKIAEPKRPPKLPYGEWRR